MTTEISIGTLEKSALTWAKSLEKLGLKVEVETHRCGRGGDPLYGRGGSWVELTVTGTYTDSEGDSAEAYTTVRFGTGSYYAGREKASFGTENGFKLAKARAKEYLFQDLCKQGWVLPLT